MIYHDGKRIRHVFLIYGGMVIASLFMIPSSYEFAFLLFAIFFFVPGIGLVLMPPESNWFFPVLLLSLFFTYLEAKFLGSYRVVKLSTLAVSPPKIVELAEDKSANNQN